MNKNQKFSELLRFVANIAKYPCDDVETPCICISCEARNLVRRVTYKEDNPMEREEDTRQC